MNFKKKLNIRVKYYTGQKYCIEYTYYRFFKSWNIINEWLILSHSWNPVLLGYKEAENFASQFKTYDHIVLFYIEQAKEQKKAKELSRPYEIKNII